MTRRTTPEPRPARRERASAANHAGAAVKNGWLIKKLADVADSISTGPFGTMLHKSDYVLDGIPLVNPVNIVDSQIVPSTKMMISEKTRHRLSKYKLRKGDIVVGRRGDLGRCAIVTEKEDGWLCGTGSCFIRLSEQINERFFVMLFGSSRFRSLLEAASVGTTMSNLNHGILNNLPIPFPPLPEQQRIVAILDEAFDGLAAAKATAEQNLQNARALFESHLQAVFTQRGEAWVEKKVGEVCILRSGTTLPKDIEKPSGEIPYLKVADMNMSENLSGVTCSSRYVNKNDVNASNLLPIGTTIFPKRGGAILTNKKRITERVICADLNIMGVTPKSGLLPDFVFNYFLRLDLRAINNGSSIPQINNYNIEPLLIAFPQSLTEQRTIVVKLESLSEETKRLASLYQRKLAALDELKKSLLHQAFSGQL